MSTKAFCRLLVLTLLASSSLGKLFTDFSQLTKTTYDYVVIGAGTAGNVVAARLSENPAVSVLVLEAGGSNEGILAAQIPLLGPSLVPNTILDWNYTTTPQTGYNGRIIQYPRGRVLGGSSTVNYMVFAHGSSDDWNRYASVTGDPGWNWNNIQQYVQKNEKFVAPADNHNTAGQFNPAVHGYHGAVSISLPGYPTPLDNRVLATTRELPEFPFILDTADGGNVLGIGWTQSSIGQGTRSSSATAYLSPALSRPNLDVLINAQVTKLVKTGVVAGLPSFHSVQFATGAGATVHTVSSRKEIILSAGTFGTPTILQLSGIGAQSELSAVGITTIVNNPSVGHNMSDHALLSNVYSVNSTDTFDTIFRNPDILNADIAEWQAHKDGPLADGVANHLGFLRLPQTDSIFQTTPDPSAGPKSSHWEVIFSNLWVVPGTPAPPTGNYFSITTNVISPTSRGNIKLASSNPFDKPLINPNFMATAFDLFTMREAVKAIKRFVAARAWNGYIIGPVGPLVNANTDAQIEAYVRANGATVFHATGTASMSPKGASWGVVDPDLKVKGVEGLRIADGSVLPYIPNAHTQGPIYLVGERAADLIKGH